MATKFSNPNVQLLLGVTPISTASDQQLMTLLSPMTKALLGKIVSCSEPEVKETTQGDFPGDEVSNLSDHRLYGGQSGYVRNPYIVTTYKTEYGSIKIKRDGVKFKMFCWFGDVSKGQGELVFKVALRDRCFDGTPRANDCSLIDFIGYDDPKINPPLSFNGQLVDSTEMSVYTFMPGSRVSDVCGDDELERFIGNPFTFLDRPQLFRQLFDRVWKSKRAPGMTGNPVPDVSRNVIFPLEELARSKGYDFMTNTPSHYHAAMWLKSYGYRYVDPKHEAVLDAFAQGLKKLKEAGIKLTRTQESWVCVVQSLPAELIPEGLNLNGPKWPQDNIGPENLWMYKSLTPEGKAIVSKAQSARVGEAAADKSVPSPPSEKSEKAAQ